MPAYLAKELKDYNDKNPNKKVFVRTFKDGDKLTASYCDENGRDLSALSSLLSDESDRPHGKITAVSINPSDGICRNAYKILVTEQTLSGWGPMLYDCILVLAGDRGVTPDRANITPEAVRVWQIYYNNRKSDVKTLPLDINKSTPDPEDDCVSDHETFGVIGNPQLKEKGILNIVNQVYYDSGIKTLSNLESFGLVYKQKAKTEPSNLFELYQSFLQEVRNIKYL
jgi:hypothetical protein